MIPKRSWATLVPEIIYEHLKDNPDTFTVEIPVLDWTGNNPAPEDIVYLIKPKTKDRFKDAGIFCVTVLTKLESGTAWLRIENDAILTQKNRSYIRFDSLNLKDKHLRGVQAKADKVGAAYFLEDSASVRIEILFRKTDVTFTSLDAKISLLAYEESFAAGKSPEGSEFTVKAAIECGRLVSSISSKISNYKYLDPRVKGGLRNGAKIDKKTWEEYFDPRINRVDIPRLRQDIANESMDYEFTYVIEENSDPIIDSNIPNDEKRYQAYTRRVRQGQSRFRKALLILYGYQCAFTKTNESIVLEACHIISHVKTGDNSLDNGLLLRSDIHVLFDEGLMTLANDGKRVCVRHDVTAPEYAKLHNSLSQTRHSTHERHLDFIQKRNSELNWVK
jgi:hypothetical protein